MAAGLFSLVTLYSQNFIQLTLQSDSVSYPFLVGHGLRVIHQSRGGDAVSTGSCRCSLLRCSSTTGEAFYALASDCCSIGVRQICRDQ